ncbi:nucleoid occlusion factor SlmA [SAR86 cluster bacterium]|jgi:TetR/AcrR family transcriptional regulator|nr:nucleoid occlusion factor SlmA [SAR86 cluster bacterium]
MSKDPAPRKIQIMQTLASMLEEREPVKITTAELARRTNITEAAIYRHFPSKRKIYEELVNFFESSVFPRIGSIKKDSNIDDVAGNIVTLVLTFCEKNKGISKILNREALSVSESKIEDKISLLFDKINLEIKQSFQNYEKETKGRLSLNSSSASDLIISCMEGQIQMFVRSKFKRDIVESWTEHWKVLKKTIFI